MMGIFANARMARNIARLSRYLHFKTNYHTVKCFLTILQYRYKCRIYSKSIAFKLRSFIAVGPVFNKIIIYERPPLNIDKN